MLLLSAFYSSFLVISFILSTILSQLSMLSISSLRFRLTSLHSSFRRCWGVSGDLHGLRRRATLRRWNVRKSNVSHPRMALRGVQSRFRERRQLYYTSLISKRQNVIPDSSAGRAPHLCVKSRGGTKWLYGTNGSYDKCYDDLPTTSAEELRGLRVKLGGGVKRLYGATEVDTELGRGVSISWDRKTEDSSVFPSDVAQHVLNSSYDSTDSLTIPFRNVGDDWRIRANENIPLTIKLFRPHSTEKQDTREQHHNTCARTQRITHGSVRAQTKTNLSILTNLYQNNVRAADLTYSIYSTNN